VVLFVVAGFVASNSADAETHNPIIRANVPDIAIIGVGKTYYMSSTTMHMSPGLKTIAESSLGIDLAPPAILGVKLAGAPGKASWSWPKLGDGQTTYDVQRRFIDHAAAVRNLRLARSGGAVVEFQIAK